MVVVVEVVERCIEARKRQVREGGAGFACPRLSSPIIGPSAVVRVDVCVVRSCVEKLFYKYIARETRPAVFYFLCYLNVIG